MGLAKYLENQKGDRNSFLLLQGILFHGSNSRWKEESEKQGTIPKFDTGGNSLFCSPLNLRSEEDGAMMVVEGRVAPVHHMETIQVGWEPGVLRWGESTKLLHKGICPHGRGRALPAGAQEKPLQFASSKYKEKTERSAIPNSPSEAISV